MRLLATTEVRPALVIECDGAARDFIGTLLNAAGYAVRDYQAPNVLSCLTPRERSVFDCIVAGRSNKLAARELGLSPRTVEFYRARIMVKMKAESVPDLVRIALAA